MNRFFITVLTLAVVGGFVCGCKGKRDKDETEDKTEMARGSYNAEKNVVTVVPLERKVFNKQLVCNGKLEAQSKVTLQFSGQGKVAEINVRDGQKVQKGQVLASLDRSSLAASWSRHAWRMTRRRYSWQTVCSTTATP